jgi:hypothetical protein
MSMSSEDYDPEYKPIVELHATSVDTGEEEEEEIESVEGKLYRWGVGNDGEQWKMRATGNVRLLRNNDKVRVIMREGQVQKVRLNHFIKGINIRFKEGNDKYLLWESVDYSKSENIKEENDVSKIHQFALRFRTVDAAKKFKKVWESCKQESCSIKDRLDILKLPENFYDEEEKKEEKKEERLIEEKFEDMILHRLDKLERMMAKMSRSMAKMSCGIDWLMKNELNEKV